MKPAIKSDVIWEHLSNLNAWMRKDGKRIYIPDAIKKDVCAKCDGPARWISLDTIERDEYAMTGMCIHCQIEMYASLERHNKGGDLPL